MAKVGDGDGDGDGDGGGAGGRVSVLMRLRAVITGARILVREPSAP
jgi:hypothetical protein